MKIPSFLRSISERQLYILLKAAPLVLCIMFFVFFRNVDKRQKSQVRQNIAAILRNELSVSNSYAISKTLVDLENIEIFKCARLTELNDSRRIFYDTVAGKQCDYGLFSRLNSQTQVLHGLNGLPYELYFISYVNWFALLFEITIYMLLLNLSLFLPKYIDRIIKAEKSKRSILEIQRQTLIEMNKQATHDVASPLGAIRMMMSLMHNVDPEIKDVLSKSINRTMDIFESLKKTNQTTQQINISKCISEVVMEKRIIWGTSCRLIFQNEPTTNITGIGNEIDLKRILSNILNNSYESFTRDKESALIEVRLESSPEEVVITVSDNGCGMTEEVLSKLGTQGFSFGKKDHAVAGSGLGVSHALRTLQLWGGQLRYSSQAQEGTSAEIRLLCS